MTNYNSWLTTTCKLLEFTEIGLWAPTPPLRGLQYYLQYRGIRGIYYRTPMLQIVYSIQKVSHYSILGFLYQHQATEFGRQGLLLKAIYLLLAAQHPRVRKGPEDERLEKSKWNSCYPSTFTCTDCTEDEEWSSSVTHSPALEPKHWTATMEKVESKRRVQAAGFAN